MIRSWSLPCSHHAIGSCATVVHVDMKRNSEKCSACHTGLTHRLGGPSPTHTLLPIPPSEPPSPCRFPPSRLSWDQTHTAPSAMAVKVILVGLGSVGRAVLTRLRASSSAVTGVTFHIAAVADSASILTSPLDGRDGNATDTPLDEPTLDAVVAAKAARRPLASVTAVHPFVLIRNDGSAEDGALLLRVAAAAAAAGDTPLVIDATASAATTRVLVDAAARGVRVVSANKVPFSSELSSFAALLPFPSGTASGGGDKSAGRPDDRVAAAAAARARRLVRAEAAVAAGTPVIAALTRLVASGDRVHHIVGCVSGTLGVLTTAVAAGTPLSAAVADARAGGLTEPDPRADLSGGDVARKVLIMGRLAGLATPSLDAVPVESYVGQEHLDAGGDDVDAWLAALPSADAAAAAAVSAGRRYVATIDVAAGTVKVGWAALPPESPLAGLSGSTNAVAITSDSYPPGQELVIRGSGAGVEVTALGVVADAVELAHTADVGPLEGAAGC